MGSRRGLVRPTALVLALTLLLGWAPQAQAQDAASPPATDGSPDVSALSDTCPVTLSYEVNLGQATNTTSVPIFVATVTVHNLDDKVGQGGKQGPQVSHLWAQCGVSCRPKETRPVLP